MNQRPAPNPRADALERDTGFGWGWFVVLGGVLLASGAVALFSLPVAMPSLLVVGVLMLVGAVAQLGTRLIVPHWKGTGLLVASALLYGACGILVIVNPVLASGVPTLFLACALVLCGLMRIRLGSVMPLPFGWGWITATGLATVAAGIAFIHLLLIHPVWILGVVLATDLAFQGAMALAFGCALNAARRGRYEDA